VLGVRVGPKASAVSASTPSRGSDMARFVAIAVGVVCVVVFVALLSCAAACCYRHVRCPVSVVDSRRGGAKRRVVVMHSNSLYDDDASSKHPHHHQQQQQQELAFVMPPRVKVETRGSRRRLLSTVFEYEIPLDTQWEFPRDKSVYVITDYTASLG